MSPGIGPGRRREGAGVFAFKVNDAGTAVVHSRTLDGTGDDRAGGIAVDAEGNIDVAGYTTPSAYPWHSWNVGPGLVPKSVAGAHDVFVVKWDPTPWGPPIYSGLIAGYGDDHASGIVVDGAGSAYVVGSVSSGSGGRSSL